MSNNQYGPLATEGGTKVRQEPFPTGKRFGAQELNYLEDALNQNTLFYHFGQMTKKFISKFNQVIGSKYAIACSSGTAAIHTALGAAGVGLGDEVITTSITDMGTVIGILYQNAVPVFADNLPATYAMDPADLESKITPRTKAVIVVHLAGNPCDMDAILEIARRRNLVVIEDCAQAWGCYYKGTHVGLFGKFGCFSTNDFKHISTGDGGVLCANEEELYMKAHLFADKGYDRLGKNPRNVEGLCPNYRWTELSAAVGLAQLEKLASLVETRNRLGDLLSSNIKNIPGIIQHTVTPGARCSYWFYMFQLDLQKFKIGRDDFAKALQAEGIPASAGYIPHPVYKYPLFQNENFFANGWPAKALNLTSIDYKQTSCHNAEAILKTAIRLPISEFYSEADINDMAQAIGKVAWHYAKK